MPAAQTEIEKAKQVICAMLEEGGGFFVGKLRLNKTFYVAHLIHWESQQGTLSDYPIVRLPQGPAIDNLNMLLHQLVGAGTLRIGTRMNGPYQENVYTLCGPCEPKLTPEERKSIHDAVQWVAGKSGTELSNLTHEYSRTWRTTPDGAAMNIYLDTLTDEAYEAMLVRQAQAGELLHAAVGR